MQHSSSPELWISLQDGGEHAEELHQHLLVGLSGKRIL